MPHERHADAWALERFLVIARDPRFDLKWS